MTLDEFNALTDSQKIQVILKAQAYDMIVQMEVSRNNLNAINEQLKTANGQEN